VEEDSNPMKNTKGVSNEIDFAIKHRPLIATSFESGKRE